MNLLATWRTRWAADATLNGLLPAATKLQTGVYQYAGTTPPFPFATLKQTDRYPEEQTDTTAVERATIQVTIYHSRNNHDEAVAIADAVNACFNRQHFALSGSDTVLDVERSGEQQLQDEDDDWYIVQDFVCRVYLASGV